MIAELHFQDRSTLSLKNRHALLLRRQSRENQNKKNLLQSPGKDSGIGSGSRQEASITPGDSPQSSPGDSRNAASADTQSDFQYTSNEAAVVSPKGPGGDGFMPFGPNSNTPIEMTTYDNDILMNEMSRLIQDPSSFSPGQLQQSQHPQHQAFSDMSSSNHLQPGIDFSLPLTPPSMVQNSRLSDDSESWEDFLCLGISCPRKGLEAFKMAVLEAVTKGPGCQDDDQQEKVQIMLKIRRKTSS